MTKRTSFPSRFGALVLGFITLGHAMVASDLVFNFFSPTPEIVALWAASSWVKALWVATTALGVAGVVLLYRSAILGLLASLGVTVLLYFASVGLWQDLKGTFWLAVIVNLLAAVGVWREQRPNNSFKPNPHQGGGLVEALGLISIKFSQLETNLHRAGITILVMIFGGSLLAIALSIFGLDLGFVVLFVWIANLPAIWFLAKAAKHQGRNAWLTGLISIPPLLAIVNFLVLWSTASDVARIERSEGLGP